MNPTGSLSRRTALASLAGAALATRRRSWRSSGRPARLPFRPVRHLQRLPATAPLGAPSSLLSTPDNPQARNVAETIQRVDPDALLINEFDYDDHGTAVQLFLRNYLSVGHNGAKPVRFPYHFTAPVNTGVASGVDLDGKNGTVTPARFARSTWPDASCPYASDRAS